MAATSAIELMLMLFCEVALRRGGELTVRMMAARGSLRRAWKKMIVSFLTPRGGRTDGFLFLQLASYARVV